MKLLLQCKMMFHALVTMFPLQRNLTSTFTTETFRLSSSEFKFLLNTLLLVFDLVMYVSLPPVPPDLLLGSGNLPSSITSMKHTGCLLIRSPPGSDAVLYRDWSGDLSISPWKTRLPYKYDFSGFLGTIPRLSVLVRVYFVLSFVTEAKLSVLVGHLLFCLALTNITFQDACGKAR